MKRRKSFKADDLEIVARATHEEVIPGDFVWLASGSPIGLVTHTEEGVASVSWLTSPPQRTQISWLCLRSAPCHVGQ